MLYTRFSSRRATEEVLPSADRRLRVFWWLIAAGGTAIIIRLFFLMIVGHDFYSALAREAQDAARALVPKRGGIFIQDSRTGETFPLAMNRDAFTVYGDTRSLSSKDAERAAGRLADMLAYTAEERTALGESLGMQGDPYVPIERRVSGALADEIRRLELPGIGLARIDDRFYPEGRLAAHTVGFLGKAEDGRDLGHYGIEGYWQKELAGAGGFLDGLRSATGGWISLAGLSFTPSEDGANLVLSLDRSLQHAACERLRRGLMEYKAKSASLALLEPATGAIRALCSLPDFDPNAYSDAPDVSVYNNTAIFSAYEPGSIFKPLVMSAALHEELVSPDTPFTDPGERQGVCDTPIRNAEGRRYGRQTMTGVLQNSINTGMVYVAEKLGKKRLRSFIEDFGFGVKTGIELDTESAGSIASLSKNSDDIVLDCYSATASFGQGISATVLQMASAFGAIGNGGMLMRPYIVEEARHTDGRIAKTRPRPLRQVISKKAASLVSAMLVQVVEHGYGGRARVSSYYVAGKTGTAQIPGPGGYTDKTNHSFVGFAPADAPKFVIAIRYEAPDRPYAESTAAPVFADIAKFALQYYGVAPAR